MSGLDYDTIQQLLKEDKAQPITSPKTSEKFPPHPRPVQIGPLSYNAENPSRCVSKGCGAPSVIKVDGVNYCSSHALSVLNRMILDYRGIDYSDCNCKAGYHSKMNVHTEFCPVFKRTKEQRDNSNTRESAEGIDPS